VLSDLAAGLTGVERGYTGGGEVAQVAGHHGELLLQGGGGDQQVGAERRLAIPRSMPEGSPAVAIA
jgi:hypothetical protein